MDRALLLALLLGPALALRRAVPSDGKTEPSDAIPESSSESGVWRERRATGDSTEVDEKWRAAGNYTEVDERFRAMGNYTLVDNMTLYSPIPALQGCQGFDCIERYVKFDDGAFSWGVEMGPRPLSRGKVSLTEYMLKLSSQAWMAKETRRDAWTHVLKVFVPETYAAGGKNADLAILFVEIGEDDTWAAREMAARSGTVTAVIANVPNAPLSFGKDGKYVLGEEALKAWSWYKFVQDAEHPEWPVEMPNVKAVMRGMDAIVAFTRDARQQTEIAPMEKFVIVGHSKRAMAAYMAAAVDTRVKAIVPIGISLDVYQAFQQNEKNLGGVPFAAMPYKQQGTLTITEEQMKKLAGITDPLTYISRLTMPKLTIFSGADDFFPPDVSRSWWWQLPQQKMMYMFGDSDHRGITEEHNGQDKFLDVADAFICGFLSGQEMPEISWTIDAESGTISVTQVSKHTPTSVVVMSARTKDGSRRDFRKAKYARRGPLEPVAGSNGRRWEAKPPDTGKWVAFFVAFEYEGPRSASVPWRLSTEVSVTPNERPYPEAESVVPKWQRLIPPPNSPWWMR